MYYNIIEGMVARLVAQGLLDVNLKDLAETELKSMWEDRIAIVWATYDVHFAANREHRCMTEGEAKEILQRILHKSEADVGVNWEVIVSFSEDFGRPMTLDEIKRYELDPTHPPLVLPDV